MAHNFKLTGDYYVSVDGSDSNSGLTKDAPKRTIQAGLNLLSLAGQTLIIGSGAYKETLSRTFNFTNQSVIGDGSVVVYGDNSNSITFSSNGSITFQNIYFKIQGTLSTVAQPVSMTFINCVFSNSSITISGGRFDTTFSLLRCIFINVSTIISYSGALYGNSCLFINTNMSFLSFGNCQNSYFDRTSILTSVLTTSTNYNNIQGYVLVTSATSVTTGTYQDVYGRYYNLTLASGGDGTVGNPYGRAETSGKAFSYTNHRILHPTLNANSISLDPKFNKIEAQDFTLQADSPHIGRASDGISNIGGTNYAIRDAANGDVFYTSAVSRTNLAFLGNDQIVSGGTSGEVISAPRFVSNIPKVLQKISYVGLLEFNKSVTGGTTGNKNVPDQEVYDSTTQPPNVAGANPDRLVYYMRFSTQVAQPATSSEWDNGGLWTAGNYETFEWNTKPSVDNVGVGNGSPSFNAAATPVYLNATWIQMKVKLRNDYV